MRSMSEKNVCLCAYSTHIDGGLDSCIANLRGKTATLTEDIIMLYTEERMYTTPISTKGFT